MYVMQEIPSPHRDLFGFRFITLARAWRRRIDIELAREGLTDATWTPLIHLDSGGDGISQTELAERLGLDTSTLVRLIDLLAARGLIERRVFAQDRRTRLIFLTTEGQGEVARLRERLLAIEYQMLADLGDARLGDILQDFDKIAARITSAPEEDQK